MGGSSIICPGADPDNAYIIESRSFVACSKATLDGRDRLSLPILRPIVHHPRKVSCPLDAELFMTVIRHDRLQVSSLLQYYSSSQLKLCTRPFLCCSVGINNVPLTICLFPFHVTNANCIEAAVPLPFQDFVVDLREHLRAVWRKLDGADPRTHAQKLATSSDHAWMALPLKPSNVRGPPHLLPRYLELELSRHVLRNRSV